MKKNSFDPFMLNNFSNLINNSKSASISTNEPSAVDFSSKTFMEKASSVRIPKVRTGLVLLVSSDSIGESNDLGNALMNSFLESISCGLEFPEYIFFINTGVKLVAAEAMLNHLKKIKKYGTHIIASVESLEYFNFENCKSIQKWSIGDITTVLMSADKVIKI